MDGLIAQAAAIPCSVSLVFGLRQLRLLVHVVLCPCLTCTCRERRKQKYSTLQETVDELSTRLGQLNTLEAANSELQQRNQQLEVVVKEQNSQLQAQKDTITRQAQQLQTQVGVRLVCLQRRGIARQSTCCPLLALGHPAAVFCAVGV